MKIKTVITLLLTFLLAACDRTPPEVVESVRPVKIFTVEDSGQNGTRYFPARLQAGDETQLSFKRSGQLQQLLVREGEQVKKGQLLLEFDIPGIKEAGYEVTTPIVVTNSDEFNDVEMKAEGQVTVGVELLELS